MSSLLRGPLDLDDDQLLGRADHHEPGAGPASPDGVRTSERWPGRVQTGGDLLGVSGGGFEITRWRTYGGNLAVADAKIGHNDCAPNCGSGHMTFSTVVIHLTRIAPCKGSPAYAEAEIMKSSDPAEEGSITDLAAFCSES